MTLTPDQTDTLAKASESALRLKRFADKAQALGLTVLAFHIRDASVACQYGVDMQRRAFEDSLLSQTGAVVVDRESRGSLLGESDGTIEAMADAIQRKGLLK